MFDFHEKRKIQRYVYSRPVIGLIFILAIMLSFSVYDRYVVSREMREKLEAKYQELEELEMRAQALESKVQYLGDERGIEEELRSRFDVAKEGEQVVILLDSKREQKVATTVSSEDSEVSTSSEESFWDTILFWR